MPNNWPALLLGIIITAYWARVLRMAQKTRKRTGRTANLLPPEPLGRFLRLIWQPVVWIWIAHPWISTWLTRPPTVLTPLFYSPIAQWLGVAFALFAFIATRACWKRMGKSWRMGIDPNEQTNLVVSGPYAYIRHPIYALSSLLMIATVLIIPTPLMIAVAVAHLLLLQWEARREEKYLSQIHGPQYDLYCRRVGRFIPRLARSRPVIAS